MVPLHFSLGDRMRPYFKQKLLSYHRSSGQKEGLICENVGHDFGARSSFKKNKSTSCVCVCVCVCVCKTESWAGHGGSCL